MLKLIDTHAHLDHLEDLDDAMSRASSSGVSNIIAVSEDLNSSKKNLNIKSKYIDPAISVAIGVHPSEANKVVIEDTVDFIKSNNDKICAIGEIGLDFWYKWVRKDFEQKDIQIKVFEILLQLAKEYDLPVVVHSRGAWKECFDLVKTMDIKKAEFHWYSGPIDVLDKILEHGYYVSATPSIVYSKEARIAIKHAPIEQIMIETDTPVYYRMRGSYAEEKGIENFQSEPKDVFVTLNAYCDLKKIDVNQGAEILNNNAKKFFNIV